MEGGGASTALFSCVASLRTSRKPRNQPMRKLIWILRLLIFLLLLVFLARNSGTVTLRFFLDAAWEIPLSLVMLLFFALGAAAALASAFPTVFRQRRELSRLRRASRPEEARTAE